VILQFLSIIEQSAKTAFADISKFQKSTLENVTNIVESFMPKDFRMTMLQYARSRKEIAYAAEVDALVKRGGTIKEKYDLLWNQQMQRRESLVALGNATGIYKAIVTVIAGCPQVLLDFTKQFNAPNGPMEEYRIKYGPNLYSLTGFIYDVNTLMEMSVNSKDGRIVREIFELSAKGIAIYAREMANLCTFLAAILKSSPFFITKEQASSCDSESDKPIELQIAAWGTQVVPFKAEVGETLTIEFKPTAYDVGFELSFKPDDSDIVQILYPNQRYKDITKIDKIAPLSGTFNAKFDNSYSYMTTKTVHYKAVIVPKDDVKTDSSV